MRTLLISLLICGVGFGTAALITSPRAGAQALVDGTLTANVGNAVNHDAFSIGISPTTVPEGTYEIDVNDYSSLHNFRFCNKGVDALHCASGATVNQATDVLGTGLTVWTVALTPGTYIYLCDEHHTMHGTLTVTGPGGTTTSTTPALNLKLVSTSASRKVITVKAKTNLTSHFTGVLLDKTQTTQLATVETDGTIVTLKLRPAAKLTKGKYVVKLTADSAGESVTKQKTVTVF